MVTRTLLDYNRRPVDFAADKVVDVLPEYFRTEYPNLVTFLEKYYEFLDSDATYGFSREIKDLYRVRDLDAAELDELDFIFKEIGQNNLAASNFVKPRFSASLLAGHYRSKGSLRSAKQFFRSIYGEEPDIQYPKNNLFIIGEADSKIGSESIKYIQDGEKYQILSVLVRSSIPISQWRDLYKRFVHVAGFNLSGEVVLESVVDADVEYMPIVIPSINELVVEGAAITTATALTSLVGIWPDGGDADSAPEYLDLNATVRAYSEVTIEQLNSMYETIEDALDANSPTMDDDSAVGIKFSNTIETLDNDEYNN